MYRYGATTLTRNIARWIGVLAVITCVTQSQVARAQLVVNEPGAQMDFDLSDNVCAVCTQVDNNGNCTQLRGCTFVAAIQNANKSGNVTTITFAVPVVETPTNFEMPVITTPVILDGDTGTGRAHIRAPAVLDTPPGIRVEGNGALGSEFRNLEISGFNFGIQFVNTSAGVVEGCVIHDNSGAGVIGFGTTSVIRVGGGTEAPGLSPGNVFYGNDTGISLSGGGNHLVLGNLIGFDEQGQAAGNNSGIFIGIGAGEGTQIGSEITDQRNVISNSQISGISVSGTAVGFSEPVTGLRIRGNYIGTDVTGTQAFANRQGIVIGRSEGILVGGDGPGEGNLISGNGDGIWLNSSATAARVIGNTIGLDVNGNPLPNVNGVVIRATARDNLVQNNVISGNTGNGVLITKVNNFKPSRNSIELNTIGLDRERMSGDVGNGGSGIRISESDSNAIGLNFIGANGEYGIVVDGLESVENRILDNTIGGVNTQLQPLGNGMAGILVMLGARTFIERNDIGNNGGDGIDLLGATETTIASNKIGVLVNEDGDFAMGNQGAGVRLRGEADANTIGGTDATKGNVIGFNKKGIVVEDGQRNAMLGNKIFFNQEMAIDLGDDGFTLNDDLDADAGPNGLQNAPIQTGVGMQGMTTIIEGEIRSKPSATYRIEFFEDSLDAEQPDHLQADLFIGFLEVQTDDNGVGTFTFENEGQADVVATATDADGNTSELGLLTFLSVNDALTHFFQDPTDDLLDPETLAPPDGPTGFTEEEQDSGDIVEVRAGQEGDKLTVEVEHAGSGTEAPRTIRILVDGDGETHLAGDDLDPLDQFITRVFEGTLIGNEVVGTSMSTVNENGELDTTENPDGLEVTPLGDKTVEVKIDQDALPDNYGLGILTSLRDQLPPGNVS